MISDAHEGRKAAAAKVLHATWQRCRIHVLRNLLAHVGPSQRAMAAAIRTVFTQENQAAARRQWRQVADGLRERFERLAKAMDAAEDPRVRLSPARGQAVLAYMTFHPDHWTRISSTNSLERLIGEIKRRTDVVGIFPNDAAIVRLVGALMLEQNDEWAVGRRYMSLETLAPTGHTDHVRLPAVAA